MVRDIGFAARAHATPRPKLSLSSNALLAPPQASAAPIFAPMIWICTHQRSCSTSTCCTSALLADSSRRSRTGVLAPRRGPSLATRQSSARTTRCLHGSSSTRAAVCPNQKSPMAPLERMCRLAGALLVGCSGCQEGWPHVRDRLLPLVCVCRHHVTDSNLWCENFTMNRYQRGGITTCHAGRSSALKMQVERYGKTDPQSRARSKYIEPEGGRFVPPLKPACSRDKGPDPYGVGDHAKWMIASTGASPPAFPASRRRAHPMQPSRITSASLCSLACHQATTAAWALLRRISRCGIRTVCPATISRCEERAGRLATEPFAALF